jgi:hypothetical protein
LLNNRGNRVAEAVVHTEKSVSGPGQFQSLEMSAKAFGVWDLVSAAKLDPAEIDRRFSVVFFIIQAAMQ